MAHLKSEKSSLRPSQAATPLPELDPSDPVAGTGAEGLMKSWKQPWRESLGIGLLALGIFLTLACYSFDPSDYTSQGVTKQPFNRAGPWGAVAAAHVLGRLGLVGMVWPLLLILWGTVMALGRVVIPHPRRILGWTLLSVLAASFVHIYVPPTPRFPEPTFGYGGLLGQAVGGTLLSYLGPGGSAVILAALSLVCLITTEGLSLARASHLCKHYFMDSLYLTRRFFRRSLRPWTLGFLEAIGDHTLRSTERLLRLCLPKELFEKWVPRFSQGPGGLEQNPPASGLAPDRTRGKKLSSLLDSAAQEPGAPLPGGSSPSRPAPTPRKEVRPYDPAGTVHTKISLDLYYDGPTHGKPESHLFSRTVASTKHAGEDQQAALELVKQLAEFRIFGDITAVTHGPVVTTFEFKPAAGTKVAKISAVGEDLARMLKATSLRVLAPIPGKDTVGFEIPCRPDERSIIGFSELLAAKEFHNPKRRLPIAMGVDIFGLPVIEDLADMPHLLVAGSTGSGKSVFMNTLVGSLIARHTAQSLRLVMIDPKMVELAAYNGLPHMACPVITDTAVEAKAVLYLLVDEMERRYRAMRALGVRSIEGFNEIIKLRRKSEFIDYEGPWLPLPWMVLIIDEMADMMMTLGRDAETPIARLAQKARAAGIHMVIATQRPSADVVTGLIKANFPTRIAFRVLSGIDSRTILDQVGAETLLGKGDMLYLASGGTKRVHGAYLSEAEVQNMVKACKKKRP